MVDMQFFQLNSQILSIVNASNEADATLLITGNTGTGKSHLAYAVHKASRRATTGRWYKVNLATLSENLIESELFGHERGAFTGADTRRVGRLEACNGGTVFLDEIGELPVRLQAKLLDFIQYKKITPVGGNREIELDVRVVVATNRNLESAVKSGDFRADLYHRLNVFQVRLPDLAVNPKAALQLAEGFLARHAKRPGRRLQALSRAAEQVFRNYPWPGNIRELENVIEFASAMESGDTIRLQALPSYLVEFARSNLKLDEDGGDLCAVNNSEIAAESPPIGRSAIPYADALAVLELPVSLDFHEARQAFERKYLEEVLRHCGGQINLTSRRIGLNKVSLTDKIKRYGIDWRRIRHETLAPQFAGAPGAA